jgi:hypothetical protein
VAAGEEAPPEREVGVEAREAVEAVEAAEEEPSPLKKVRSWHCWMRAVLLREASDQCTYAV